MDSQVSQFFITPVYFINSAMDFINEMAFMATSSFKYHLGSKQIVVTDSNVTYSCCSIIPIRKLYSTLLF